MYCCRALDQACFTREKVLHDAGGLLSEQRQRASPGAVLMCSIFYHLSSPVSERRLRAAQQTPSSRPIPLLAPTRRKTVCRSDRYCQGSISVRQGETRQLACSCSGNHCPNRAGGVALDSGLAGLVLLEQVHCDAVEEREFLRFLAVGAEVFAETAEGHAVPAFRAACDPPPPNRSCAVCLAIG